MPHVDGNDDGAGYGVYGFHFSGPVGQGVRGVNSTDPFGGLGVVPADPSVQPPLPPAGVYGSGVNVAGVYGESVLFDAVHGESYSNQYAGISGINNWGGPGVSGSASKYNGVHGESQSNEHAGVAGINNFGGPGVFGGSNGLDGVQGVSGSPDHAGVSARNQSAATGQVPSGFAVWAVSNNTGLFASGTPAGYFEGDVLVTGDLVLINEGGDVVEDFDVEAAPLNLEPGTVLVISDCGKLAACRTAYDTRVAGVVSGAGNLRPALVLQRFESVQARAPIALVGKVFCKADASSSPIMPGDLLTTSATPGHAMKALDSSTAVGAILGKALRALDTGLGLIPILVSPR